MADRSMPDMSGSDREMGYTGRDARTEAGGTERGDDGHVNLAADVKEDVKQTAVRAGERAQARVREEVREGKDTAAKKVNAIAHALRRVGESLDEEGESDLARYGRRTAEQIDRFAGYLDRKDVRGLMSDLEGAARRNPGTFVATTFAAGLLLGRFIRSSAPEDESDNRWSEEWQRRPDRTDDLNMRQSYAGDGIDGSGFEYGDPDTSTLGRSGDLESGPR